MPQCCHRRRRPLPHGTRQDRRRPVRASTRSTCSPRCSTALVERNDLDPGTVDDVLVGCVGQAGEQSATPGRQAWLAAGLPEHVPSVTIERKCGSGQQALDFAVAGHHRRRLRHRHRRRRGVDEPGADGFGPRWDADPHGPPVSARASPDLVPQGVSAELVAQKWGLTRGAARRVRGRLARPGRRGRRLRRLRPRDRAGHDARTASSSTDETIRPGTTVEKLGSAEAGLRAPAPTPRRFPELDWKVTAGNSSQITDGARALLVMSEERAAALGLRPRAPGSWPSAVVGDDPLLMLTGPIPATAQGARPGRADASTTSTPSR